MSRFYGGSSVLPVNKKKTVQGSGKYTKRSHSGGETFHAGARAGSPPGARHRRRKPSKGQGK